MKITPKELYDILYAFSQRHPLTMLRDWDLNKFAELINQLGAE